MKSVSFEHALDVQDEQGPILGRFEHRGTDGPAWVSDRPTLGRVIFTYNVFPSHNQDDEFGFHRDGKGLTGSGLSSIPIPTSGNVYRHIVQWNLDDPFVPQGTRAVWTHGEGPGPTEKIGPASILNESVFLVGPVRSFPPGPIAGSISDYYGYYWFGDLPPNVAGIRDIHHAYAIKIPEFFEDSLTPDNSYRSFVRNRGHTKAFRGTGFRNSHVFDYDKRISQADDYDLVRIISYEMTYNWLGPPVSSQGFDWFYEGLKNCLSVYMPFRNKFRTGDYFQATINTLCTRYYTNPHISLSHEELVRLAETDDYAKDLLSSRAWAIAVSTDIRTRWMMQGKLMRPVEDLVIKPLATRRARGEPHGIEVWLELLKPIMGNEAQERYEDMLAGKTILLDPRLFGAKTHYLKQIDMEVLDFGMDRKSFDAGMVTGLKEGSRAEEAGLREGDKITSNSYLWRCEAHFEEKMEVTVEKEGVEETIRYWPRSYTKAKGWQMVKREEGKEVAVQ